MPESVVVPSDRDIRASLDTPDADAAVIACPPHPQYGGSRSDTRLRGVSDALAPDIATLRFDYGAWDEGRGEVADAGDALAHLREKYDRVGVFGYSFGGGVALLAAAAESRDGTAPLAVSALAPTARLSDADGLDAVAALDAIDAPVQVVYGERDDTANWEPVVERARATDRTVASLSADHFFVGRTGKAGDLVAGFLREQL